MTDSDRKLQSTPIGQIEAFTVAARAWKAEAELSTHRNVCHECTPGALCGRGNMFLQFAEVAKKRMMEVAEELGVRTL